jgi:hypothetical protein
MNTAWLRRIAGEIQPEIAHAPGVAIVRGAWIPRLGGFLAGMAGPAAAVTLGNTIIVHPDVALTPRLLSHELAHVRQWNQRPFAFPVHYIWHHIRLGYHANPFEVDARAAESSPGEGHGA